MQYNPSSGKLKGSQEKFQLSAVVGFYFLWMQCCAHGVANYIGFVPDSALPLNCLLIVWVDLFIFSKKMLNHSIVKLLFWLLTQGQVHLVIHNVLPTILNFFPVVLSHTSFENDSFTHSVLSWWEYKERCLLPSPWPRQAQAGLYTGD